MIPQNPNFVPQNQFQFPIPNQNQQPFQPINPNNQNNPQMPDFQDFLNKANFFSENCIAPASKAKYESYIRVYESVMAKFNRPAYPVTIETMKVFITFQAYQNMTYNTLKAYFTGFSYYFSKNRAINLTLSIEFKEFKKGIERYFKEAYNPFAKKPWQIDFFLKYLQIMRTNDIDQVRLMFYMSLSFFGFLRMSELLALKRKDFIIDAMNNRIMLYIRYSKTDQTGKGSKTFIYYSNKPYHPIHFCGFIAKLKDEDYICNLTRDYLYKQLNDLLISIGEDPTQYAWHSFRRGGATLASQHHVDPAVIKTHGRWLSEAYLLYVDRDQEAAGMQVSDVL